MKLINSIIAATSIFLLLSCGSSKQMVSNSSNKGNATEANNSLRQKELAFVQKVSDNAAYQKSLSSKLTFTLNKGEKNISVDGQIHMKRDEVIRIQLAPLGLIEVGRIEFRPKDVLILIRPTKEYIQASYDDIDFLKRNGLNFYSLQALFWNQFFMPNKQRVSQQMLEDFTADMSGNGNNIPITLNDGAMSYKWTANQSTAQIVKAEAHYQSATNGRSSLEWLYSDFNAIGSKKFPLNHQFTLKANDDTGKHTTITVALRLKKLDTNASFDTYTEVSDKYKKITVEQAVRRIMSI